MSATATWAFSLESNNSYFAFIVRRKSSSEFLVDAVDHSNCFTALLTEEQFADFKFPKNKMDPESWQAVVRYILLGEIDGQRVTDIYDDLKLECKPSEGEEGVVLSVKQVYRTAMGEVDAKLGDIPLEKKRSCKSDDSLKFLFEFGQILRAKQQALVVAEHELRGLRRQTDELVQAKKDYEQDLFDRFAVLLNEKKLKINELMGYGTENVYVSEPIKREGSVAVKQEEEQLFSVSQNSRKRSREEDTTRTVTQVQVKEEPTPQQIVEKPETPEVYDWEEVQTEDIETVDEETEDEE